MGGGSAMEARNGMDGILMDGMDGIECAEKRIESAGLFILFLCTVFNDRMVRINCSVPLYTCSGRANVSAIRAIGESSWSVCAIGVISWKRT